MPVQTVANVKTTSWSVTRPLVMHARRANEEHFPPVHTDLEIRHWNALVEARNMGRERELIRLMGRCVDDGHYPLIQSLFRH